jgi:hypothetical protein
MTKAELLQRIEAASGPDRYLNADLLAHFFVNINGVRTAFASDTVPDLTASIDAAIALVERMLPGIFWVIGQGKTNSVEKLFGCQLLFGTEEIIGSGESDHAPLAILLALLKALQESHDAE